MLSLQVHTRKFQGARDSVCKLRFLRLLTETLCHPVDILGLVVKVVSSESAS